MSERAPVTIDTIRDLKRRGVPIVMVTAYDHPSARIVERAGVDIALVGDSAAMTVLGHTTTRDITVDEMILLTRAARRGLATPLLVGDMPFGSYEESDALAVQTAKRFADAGCDGIKLEGAGEMVSRVRAIIAAGIPVMGHVGLTPQQVTSADGYRARGKTADDASGIVGDAVALEEAGCFSLVVEAVTAPVATAIMSAVSIPVIGIGAGAATDGQVLVYHDLLGLGGERVPRFVKRYAHIGDEMVAAVARFADDVRSRRYPGPEHQYGMPADEASKFVDRVGS